APADPAADPATGRIAAIAVVAGVPVAVAVVPLALAAVAVVAVAAVSATAMAVAAGVPAAVALAAMAVVAVALASTTMIVIVVAIVIVIVIVVVIMIMIVVMVVGAPGMRRGEVDTPAVRAFGISRSAERQDRKTGGECQHNTTHETTSPPGGIMQSGRHRMQVAEARRFS
ncbi:hypothetical protein, partial [Amaricoccus sp.]|uniref:hypothetical protein n=1 Tax=Amaricoccus sp. TaxID=1872485 RepID=UPI002BAC22D4